MTASNSPRPATLDQWLEHISRVHPKTIDLGLERVAQVRDALGLTPAFPIITVAGTNGKGSSCAMLEAILMHAGYRVGCYTSPHLLRYNERVRVNGAEADDAALSRTFSAVDAARGGVPLTYFEFGTLAAMLLFIEHKIDVAILEAGLGGRLDAVNAFDADCAVVASIDLDHMDYLGDTRDKIAFEKAGIFRTGKPAVCAAPDMPHTMREHARAIGARLLVIGEDFGYVEEFQQWRYWGPGGQHAGLPYPALRGAFQLANASGCMTALDQLRERLPVTMNDVRSGLLLATVPARFQVLPGRPAVILDVAHNPQAARGLAANVAAMAGYRRTIAVFAMLGDKNIGGVIEIMAPHVDDWYVAGLQEPRGTTVEHIAEALAQQRVRGGVRTFATVADAYRAACGTVSENDRILVFGSFHTVAAVMQERRSIA
ncbi:MAG TPA: bifunctional tetrahydrofolate synthase/dihydrofolate synthase [Burkholderiales bacterium]|nr:bifunctional tetrahydrofolate synthase/dihydrofolate synthase [Burkholderiales bacterium]